MTRLAAIRMPLSARTLCAGVAIGASTVFVPMLVAQGGTRRVTLSGDSVAIYNLAGRVTIEQGSGSDVAVEISYGGADASRLTERVGAVRGRDALRIIYPDDRITYRDDRWSGRSTVRVRDDGTFDDNDDNDDNDHDDRRSSRSRRVEISSSGDGLDAHADLRVLVPRGRRVRIAVAVGETRATDVDADLLLDVGAAGVTTRGTRGRLSIDAGSGGVNVTDADGRVSIDAGSGGATVAGVRGGPLSLDVGSGHVRLRDVDVATLSLDVGSGGIEATNLRAPDVSIDAGSGGVDVGIVSDVRRLKVDAGSGGVTLHLPASLGAEVSIETGSGGVDSDFAIETNKTERHAIHGRIGNGEGRIDIEAGSGAVKLLKQTRSN